MRRQDIAPGALIGVKVAGSWRAAVILEDGWIEVAGYEALTGERFRKADPPDLQLAGFALAVDKGPLEGWVPAVRYAYSRGLRVCTAPAVTLDEWQDFLALEEASKLAEDERKRLETEREQAALSAAERRRQQILTVVPGISVDAAGNLTMSFETFEAALRRGAGSDDDQGPAR